MVSFREFFCIGLAGLTLALNGCKEEKEVILEGKVISNSENYTAGSGGWRTIESTYCFSINTKYGKKTIQVMDCDIGGNRINKETIDSLVEAEKTVKLSIPKSALGKDIFYVGAEKIRVSD